MGEIKQSTKDSLKEKHLELQEEILGAKKIPKLNLQVKKIVLGQ